jgi:hypothetical protein
MMRLRRSWLTHARPAGIEDGPNSLADLIDRRQMRCAYGICARHIGRNG